MEQQQSTADQQGMQAQIDELVEFVSSPRPDVKAAAVEHVLGLTGSSDGMHYLRRTDRPLVRSLCRIVAAEPQPRVVENALGALVNLSTDEEALLSIIDANIVSALLSALKSPFGTRVERSAQLLCNLSAHPRGAAALIEPHDGAGAAAGRAAAVAGLVESLVFAERLPADPHQYAAAALVNLAQSADGRRVLLDEKRALLPLLLPFVQDESLPRRRAVLGLLKNVAFDTTAHEYLLGPQVGLAGALLAPLRSNHALSPEDEAGLPPALRTGAPGLRMQREPDRECRATIADTLLLLSGTAVGRQMFRSLSVYPILRDYEPTETDEVVRDTIWSIVEKLMLTDEPAPSATPSAAQPGRQESSSHPSVAAPTGAPAVVPVGDEGHDEIEEIEEI